ncbi:hypothetical protein Tco_0969783 [Tanacetum coccineum]
MRAADASPPLSLPPTSPRTDVPKAEILPRKRACLTTPDSGNESRESSAAGAARQPGPTPAVDTWDEWNGYLRKGRKMKPKRQNRARNGKAGKRQSPLNCLLITAYFLLSFAYLLVKCFDQTQPPQYTVNHTIFNTQNEFLNSQNKLMEQMTSICEMVGQIMQNKEEEKRIAEEQAAKDRYWKIPICYDDDEDYTIAITPIQDYALWEVIENGNSWVPIPVTTSESGPSTALKMTVPSTTEEKICKKNDVKARSLLFMALPNEHQLTFNQYADAQSMFIAIKARFRGNDTTKKKQKALLKQQYENFNATSSESLDSIFNRDYKMRCSSRLGILGVDTPPEDLNVKFLRSLPSEWDTHVVVWMNKPDFETMGLDDLYNNFKIVEQKVKRTVAVNNDDKNLAFLTTSSPSIKPHVRPFLTHSQPQGSQLVHEDLEQIHDDDLEEMDLKWNMALLSMRARKFYQRTGRKIIIDGSSTAGYDKSKITTELEKVKGIKEGFFGNKLAKFENIILQDLEEFVSKSAPLLLDFKEFDGGYVTFGGGANGGRITGKGGSKSSISSQQDQDCIFMPIWKDASYFDDASLKFVDDAQLQDQDGTHDDCHFQDDGILDDHQVNTLYCPTEKVPQVNTVDREISTNQAPEVNTATTEGLMGPIPTTEDTQVEDQELNWGIFTIL